VIVVDHQIAEVARHGPTRAGERSVTLSVDLVGRLAAGVEYHWYVESADAGPKVRSRLEPLVAPPR
jgi:hypothetical protein